MAFILEPPVRQRILDIGSLMWPLNDLQGPILAMRWPHKRTASSSFSPSSSTSKSDNIWRNWVHNWGNFSWNDYLETLKATIVERKLILKMSNFCLHLSYLCEFLMKGQSLYKYRHLFYCLSIASQFVHNERALQCSFVANSITRSILRHIFATRMWMWF